MNPVMENALVNIVREHEVGVGFGRVERNSSTEVDWTESVPKHGQGIGLWGIYRGGIYFHGARKAGLYGHKIARM